MIENNDGSFSFEEDWKYSVTLKNNKMQVNFKRLHPDAVLPSYAHPGEDAGLDLTSVQIDETPDYISYKTGIAVEIPTGYVGYLFPRSSNCKKDLLLTNSVGVVDSGYRGEIELRFKKVLNPEKAMINDYSKTIYKNGDKVGQLVIMPYPMIEPMEVEELTESKEEKKDMAQVENSIEQEEETVPIMVQLEPNGEYTQSEKKVSFVKEEILQELETLEASGEKGTKNKRVYGKPTITEISEEELKNSAPYKLDVIYKLEDDEPRKGTKAHKAWEDHLLTLYKEYNIFVGRKCFNETKVGEE